MLALKGGAVYYILPDHLATPRVIKDPTGAVVWRWQSDAFGNGVANESPSGGTPFVFNQRFPGQQYDTETGLHYNNARYYDPQVGRYITSDPVGLAGGLNTYGYASSTPLARVDPQGLTDLIYFNPRESTPNGVTMYARALAAPSPSGYFTVGGHGSSKNIVDESGRFRKLGQRIDAKQVYSDMLQAGYKRGTPVLIWSCNTGEGNNSLAEQLSQLVGAPVKAPSTWIQYKLPQAQSIPIATYSKSQAVSVFAPFSDFVNQRTFYPSSDD